MIESLEGPSNLESAAPAGPASPAFSAPVGVFGPHPTTEKALLTLVGLATTIFLLAYRWRLFSDAKADFLATPGNPPTSFAFLFEFNGYQVGGVHVSTICFWFVVLHLIRLYLGANFLDYDTSLAEAMNAEGRGRLMSVEVVLRAWLIALTTITPFLLSSEGYSGMACVLLLQALLLAFYNVLFGRVLYVGDKERVRNILIGLGDLVFAAATIFFIFCGQRAGVKAMSELFVTLFFGGYLALFLLECTLLYFRPFVALVKQAAFQKLDTAAGISAN